MKKLHVLLIAAAAIMIAGCAKEKNDANGVKNGNGFLTVRIKSDKPSRAAVDGTTLTDATVEAFEDNVTGFSAYVFNWDTGDLEGKANSADGTPATITGLNTAGQKRVVVIANGTGLTNSSIPAFVNDPNYSRITGGYLALADQSFTDFTDLSKGFLMTGENPLPLTLTVDENQVEITVKRVMAKVQLGEITFDDDVQLSDLAKFNLTGAFIQRAASYSTLGTGDITTPSTPAPRWEGGEMGSISSTLNTALASTPLDLQAWLTNLYTNEFGYTGGLTDPTITGTFGNAMNTNSVAVADATISNPGFWYVLPSAGINFTLLTLKGNYDDVDYYYPMEINDADAQGPSVTNDYIKRNTIYTINLRFRNFAGTQDPDVPGEVANLEVTVDVADWEGPVVQEITW